MQIMHEPAFRYWLLVIGYRLFFRYLGQEPSAAELRLDDGLVFKRDHAKELAQSLLRPFPVVFLPPFEDEHDFHFVSVGYEFVDLFDLDLHIVFRRAGAKPDLFQIARLLQSALFLHLLFPLVPKLIVIDDLSDGWFRIRGDLDQIEFALACDAQRFGKGEYTEEFSLFVNDAQFRGFNLMVKTKWLFQISFWLACECGCGDEEN